MNRAPRSEGRPAPWYFQAAAELSAAVLARLYGAPQDEHSYDYLARYAEQEAGDVYGLCLSVLGDVEDVLQYILKLNVGTG